VRVGAVAARSAGGEVVEVHVAPKLPIARVIFLMEHSGARVGWQEESVTVEDADELLLAVVATFERMTRRAIRRGMVQGYRTVEEAQPVVRGRIREADQLRRRFGLPVPVELRYDDFTVDIPENRLLRAAVARSRRLPHLGAGLRQRLAHLDRQFTDVAPVPGRVPLEPWRPSRLNARFWPALRLAQLIVARSSFEPPGAGLTIDGFVVNMEKVFEDFVCGALGDRLRGYGGHTATQHRLHLDRDERIELKPDLVWFDDRNQPAAVVDAKYKAGKSGRFPGADVYQMLAYCTAMRLPVGHLIYAKGVDVGRTHRITGTDLTLRAHTLDLAAPPPQLRAQLDRLAATIATRS
jgi:5-methylcytosine-specific restriction enzyme subunit McrC